MLQHSRQLNALRSPYGKVFTLMEFCLQRAKNTPCSRVNPPRTLPGQARGNTLSTGPENGQGREKWCQGWPQDDDWATSLLPSDPLPSCDTSMRISCHHTSLPQSVCASFHQMLLGGGASMGNPSPGSWACSPTSAFGLVPALAPSTSYPCPVLGVPLYKHYFIG